MPLVNLSNFLCAANEMGDESVNLSAPSCPRRAASMEDLSFNGVPTSPIRRSFKIEDNQPTIPSVYEGSNPSSIDFEFETSRRVIDNVAEKDGADEYDESVPAMAFADELFCNWKFRPLKPPPRVHYNSSSALSSPTAAGVKFPSARRCLWNDDFDPFLAALENVKEENGGKFHRRAMSMSALMALMPQKLDTQKGGEEKKSRSTMKMGEPKGVLLARKLVEMSHGKPSKECGVRREKKRKKIKRFLLRSASMTVGKSSKFYQEKPKDESGFTRKLSLRSSNGLFQHTYEHQTVSKALTHSKPNLFLCMGHGST